MIRPAPGVAFTWSDDGDVRSDAGCRRVIGENLGGGAEWATLDQVHGGSSRFVTAPGEAGPGDALVTTTPGLAVAVFTADCLGVVLHGADTVAVAHAGWRGLASGVIEGATARMAAEGSPAATAHIGPGIGPCCFEV